MRNTLLSLVVLSTLSYSELLIEDFGENKNSQEVNIKRIDLLPSIKTNQAIISNDPIDKLEIALQNLSDKKTSSILRTTVSIGELSNRNSPEVSVRTESATINVNRNSVSDTKRRRKSVIDDLFGDGQDSEFDEMTLASESGPKINFLAENVDLEDDIGDLKENLSEKKPMVKLKHYKNIKFSSEFDNFVYFNHTNSGREDFLGYLDMQDVEQDAFKEILNSDGTNKDLFISALYYDWYLQDPTLAENFYKKLFKNKRTLTKTQKFLLSEYLIRTNRGHIIHKLLKNKDCLGGFKLDSRCYYYLGFDKYMNGSTKNKYLKRAARGGSVPAKRLLKK